MRDNIISPHNWLFDYREYEILRLYQMIELKSAPFIEKAEKSSPSCFLSVCGEIKNTISFMYLQIINTILYSG